MSKMTAKYTSALTVARANGLPTSTEQETLYRRLNDNGLWWDSKAQKWIRFSDEPANEPTPKLMVRVWAASDRVNEAASDVVKGLRGRFKLINRSDPYLCRPPKQKESRVYLEFLPDDGSRATIEEILRENDPYAVEVE